MKYIENTYWVRTHEGTGGLLELLSQLKILLITLGSKPIDIFAVDVKDSLKISGKDSPRYSKIVIQNIL